MKKLSLTFLIGVLLGIGIALTLWIYVLRPPEKPRAICRPSLPEKAIEQSDVPVVLFWGNSLLFDHGWTDEAFFSVNCARQGTTAARGRFLTPALPQLSVDAILVAFGSVELAHGGAPDSFENDMREIITLLRSQYPNSKIWLSGVPYTKDTVPPWVYADTIGPSQINEILINIEGTFFFDLTGALQPIDASMQTYDGVHLTLESYMRWQNEFSRIFGAEQ